MRHTCIAVFSIALSVLIGSAAPALSQTAPYAGEQHRAIKSLSPQDVDDLIEGRGMGLAKAAELNSHPGPSHSLEFGEALNLSPQQREALEASKAQMTDRAQALGQEIVALERELDTAFARRMIDHATLADLTGRIATKQSSLRAVHLTAHLKTVALLTPDQVRCYDALRGYGGANPRQTGHQHDKH